MLLTDSWIDDSHAAENPKKKIKRHHPSTRQQHTAHRTHTHNTLNIYLLIELGTGACDILPINISILSHRCNRIR